MKVLMVEPGKTPYGTELAGDLKSMQEAVDGSIEGCYPYEDPVAIVCNEEGKVIGLPLNRAIYGFVDMDGVLAEFHPVDKIEELYEQGYFANLKPQQNVVDAVKLLCADSRFEVYILSSVLDSDYARNEKNQWLDEHIPQIDKRHRLFPAYGDSKIWIIPNGLQTTDTLLDDYSLNLNAWCPPGQAIKLMNGINGNHGTWQGMRVQYTDAPEQIASEIAEYMTQQNALEETISQEMASQPTEVIMG